MAAAARPDEAAEVLAALRTLETAISRLTCTDPSLDRVQKGLSALSGYADAVRCGPGLTALPESLLVDILARLSPRDLACVDQTCKYLHGFPSPVSPVEMAIRERASRRLLELHHRGTRPALSLILHHAESRGSGLVSAGASHCCAIDTQGRVFSWGGDVRHLLWQMDPRHYLWPLDRSVSAAGYAPPDDLCAYLGLGLGAKAHRPGETVAPKRVELPLKAGAKPVAVAAGRTHTLALCNTGDIYVWGRLADKCDNDTFFFDDDDADSDEPPKIDAKYALLGTCERKSEPSPRLLPMLGSWRIVQISAGDDHSLLLTSSGKVLAFGMNSYGQLGTDLRKEGQTRGCPDFRMTPTKVERLDHVVVSQVSAGATHSLALTVEGSVFSWGGVAEGRGLQMEKVVCPVLGHPESGWYEATSADGTPYFTREGCTSWTCPEYFPRRIAALAGQRAKQVSAGGSHSLVVTEAGDLFSFGYGPALGQGPATHVEGTVAHYTTTLIIQTPTVVRALEGKVSQANAGSGTSFALTFDHCVYSCGKADLGALGHARNDPRFENLSSSERAAFEDECCVSSFTLIKGLLQSKVISISAGAGHVLFLTQQGEVLSLGAHLGGYNADEDDLEVLFRHPFPDAMTNPELFYPRRVFRIQSKAGGNGQEDAVILE